MKDKPNDVPYCGVREHVIKAAQPRLNPRNLELNWRWISERFNIYVKKEIHKLPAPWTEDPILANHKFTNLRREHDRQSVWLIRNISSNPLYSLEEKTYLTIMFRMFNVSTFFDFVYDRYQVVNLFEFIMGVDIETLREDMQVYEEQSTQEIKWFTNAFNTGGLKQCLAFPCHDHNMKHLRDGGHSCIGTKPDGTVLEGDYKDLMEGAKKGEFKIEGFEPYMPLRVVQYIRHMYYHEPHLVNDVLSAEAPDLAYKNLKEVRGFANFLAYQVWVDLTYIEDYPFSENHFTIAGPGCIKGLDMLFEDRAGMTWEECLFWLRDNQLEVYGKLGYDPEKMFVVLEPFDRTLNVMCLENVFCETLKYIRCVQALEAGERPRTRVKYGVAPKEVKPVSKSKRLW